MIRLRAAAALSVCSGLGLVGMQVLTVILAENTTKLLKAFRLES